MDRCLTWSTDLSDVWHGPFICLMHDMVLLSVLCLTWSYNLSCAWYGRLFCHMLNSFAHATNQWYMQCMLSIYDMLSIIDVTGVRYDRWSAPIRYSRSLLDVRRWRWLGIVMVTYIIHSVMHPLIIKSLLNSFIKVLLRLLTCHILNVIIIAGALPSLDCGTVLFNWAGRIWCKMATMIVMIMAMVVIMLAMVVIMMVMVNVTPSFVDAFCIWLDHSCYVKHVNLLHVWFHHYCRVIAIAGTGWITRIAMRTT